MARLLIVDDDRIVRESVSEELANQGHDVGTVATAAEALARAADAAPFDLILLDLGLPDRHGLEVLREIRKRSETPVVVISADAEMSSTLLAMRDGACDYVPKPFRPGELEQRIDRALRTSLKARGAVPAAPAKEYRTDHVELVGDSRAMHDVYKLLGLLSASRATVLIRGESGTGKEIAARVLHGFTTAAKNLPFVAVNCAALPGPLVEAELFGYRRGAFTGADADRPGKLEAAGEGTLFLDEVGEIPLETQVKLLRVLQERQYERLGDTKARPFHARVIAATHRDLEALARDGRFREDLYYRLNVAAVTLPPLRERREDVPLIAERLVQDIARELGSRPQALTAGALAKLCNHDWPGNVRELRNVLTRAMVRSRGATLVEDDIECGAAPAPAVAERRATPPRPAPAQPSSPAHPSSSRFPTIDENERDLILRVLTHTHGHRAKTCAILGVSRPRLLRKIKRYRLEPWANAGSEDASDDPAGAEGAEADDDES